MVTAEALPAAFIDLAPPDPPPIVLTRERMSTYDLFAEQQRRLAVATHALVQVTCRLVAATDLCRPAEGLFDELRVLSFVQDRERAAMVEAATAVRTIEEKLGHE